jgi:hypothetical protein
MTIVNLAALAVLTAGLAMGCEPHEKAAGGERDKTRKSGGAARSPDGDQTNKDTNSKYAFVNGLKMYYEIHGSGRPLVLLHGAFEGTVDLDVRRACG